MVWERKETSGAAQAPCFNSCLEIKDHILSPTRVKMNHSIHMVWLESCNARMSTVSFLYNKSSVLPVQERTSLFLHSALNPREGHFSAEEKTVVLSTLSSIQASKEFPGTKKGISVASGDFVANSERIKLHKVLRIRNAALGKCMGACRLSLRQ